MSALEKYFTVAEIAELWGLCPDTIRKIFRDVPGVLRIGTPETRHQRGYISLRIPESVAKKVYADLRGAT